MPPPPLFKTPRAQTIAVAAIMFVFLIAATALAALQASRGSGYMHTRTLHEPTATSEHQSLVIATPANWKTLENTDGRLIATDPSKPERRILLTSMTARETADPFPAAERFLDQQLDEQARATYRNISDPIPIADQAAGIKGVQFIGASTDPQDAIHLHLLACLTLDQKYYWWVYLTDPIESKGNEVKALRNDLHLLKSIYHSARIVHE